MSAPLWFRLLLRLLPRRLRESHGEAIGDLAASYARRRAPLGRVLVWSRAALDVLFVAVAARLGVRVGRRSGVARPGEGDAAAGAFTRPLTGLARDARYGLRSLRRDLGFSVFAIAIVGLGVGACVTVFSVVDALLFRPLPFEEPERLVWISNGQFGRGQALSTISVQVAYVVAMRQEVPQLDDVAGYHLFDGDGDHTLSGPAGPERVTRLRVTGNLFDVLGVEPQLGRSFTAEESWDDGPRAVMLTDGFWRRSFGADPSVVGRAITLDEQPFTVVGILPRAFAFTSIFAPGRRIDYVTAYPLSERSNRSGNTLGLIGRLSPGATVASAQEEVTAVTDRLDGERLNGFDPVVRPLRDHVSGAFRPTMGVLVAGVTLVMLIVCANLSNLLLARGATRRREMAIRAALGAGRSRLVRQMLTESALLSGAGAALGLVVATYGTGVIASLDLRIPLLSEARLDAAALAVTLVAAVGVGLLFGVVPAWRGTEGRLGESLKEGARGASHGGGQRALSNALVVSELALACLLLVSSTLLIRSFMAVLDVDLGYQVENTVAIRIDPSIRFESDEERIAYYSAAMDRVGASPGVAEVGLTDVLPMAFNRRWDARAPQGENPDARVYPFVRVASEGYVETMGLTLVDGRDLRASDGPEAPEVVLVNEALAEALWPAGDHLGAIIRSGGRERTVVGVVRNTRQLSVEQAPGPELFFTYRQIGDQPRVYLLVRGERPGEELVADARAELAALDPGIPLDAVLALDDIVDASIAPRRFVVVLLTAFAGFAMLLASLGIYSVISYSVTQRRREIGIHLALGASRLDVQARIVRETLVLAVVGLGSGAVVSVAAGRVLQGMLYEVTALDPPTYLAAGVLLGGIALVAGYLPARRAARCDPVEVLAGESAGAGGRTGHATT